jgi:hypothetical protein
LLFPILTRRKPSKFAHLRCCAQMPVSGCVSRQSPASLSGARHARRVGLVDRIKCNSVWQKRKTERAQFCVAHHKEVAFALRKPHSFLNAG